MNDELCKYIVKEPTDIKLSGAARDASNEVFDSYRDLFKELHKFNCSRERSLALTKLEESYLWFKETLVRNESS